MRIEIPEGTLQIDSAIEARVISHAIAAGRGTPDDRPYITHRPMQTETLDEVDFFNREQQFGKLMLRATLTKEAETGLGRIAERQIEVEAVPPETARTFLDVINRPRLSQEATVDLPTTLEAQEQAPFTVTVSSSEDTNQNPPVTAAA